MKTLLICLLLALTACSEDASTPEAELDASTTDSTFAADDALAPPDASPDADPEPSLDAGADVARNPPDAAQQPNDAAADLADAATDAAPPPDGATPSCAEVWAAVELRVEANARPNTPAMRLVFTYGRDDANAWISLDRVDGEQVVRPTGGPFSVEENSGSWVELHDAAGATLYTRGVFQLVAESIEVPPGGDAGFMQLSQCPADGFIRLQNFPNDPAATHVVFYQSAIDGDPGGPTIEVARFPLP